MGNFGGAYTTDPRNVFDIDKRFVGFLCQTDKPISDIDQNFETYLRLAFARWIMAFLGYGAVDVGYKCVGTSANNNFLVSGGSLWLQGLRSYLAANINFDNSGVTEDGKSLHPVSTGLVALTLTDTSANYKNNELVGRELRPNIGNAMSFTIASNTATSITVSGGDMTSVASVGDHYLVEMTTPSGAGRTDYVWLNTYLDEVDGVEDSSLMRDIEGTPTECKRALKLRSTIHVRQGDVDTLDDYVDSDGNQHYTTLLAVINRIDSQDAIDAGDVTDSRTILADDTIREELTRAAEFCGADDFFSGLPEYTQENYVSEGDFLRVAVDKLDIALGGLEFVQDILVPGKGGAQNLDAIFAPAFGLDNDDVIVIFSEFAGDTGGDVIVPNKSGLDFFVMQCSLRLEQNSGNIEGIYGNGNSSEIRQLKVDADIVLQGIVVSETGGAADYNLRLFGATNLDLTLINCVLDGGYDIDEDGARTGQTVIYWRNCRFWGDISIAKLHTSTASYASDCYFNGSVTLAATGAINVEMEPAHLISSNIV